MAYIVECRIPMPTFSQAFLGQLCRLAESRTSSSSDRLLLERFVATRDEAAFTALVVRHGRMVLGVCRRVLAQSQDAEDVFQATFLVLARKAGSIHKQDSLPSWLYGVACRLAFKARAAAARRRTLERPEMTMVLQTSKSPGEASDLPARLDEELQGLPTAYRTVLVLCYLEGKSHEEAATELGCSTGALNGRLQRGRELLRQRLAKRGVVVAQAVLALTLEEQAAMAAVPPAWVSATVGAALAFAAREAVPGMAATLAQEVVTDLGSRRLFRVLAAVLALAVLSGVSGALLQRLGHTDAAEPHAVVVTDKVADKEPAKALPAPVDSHGDPLPDGAVARMGTIRFRHGKSVRCGSFAPDGKTLATGGRDGTIRLWELPSGMLIRQMTWPDGKDTTTRYVWQVAFSPDGRSLAVTCSGSNSILLFNPATGRVVQTFKGHDPVKDVIPNSVEAVAWSPDGKTLASVGTDKALRLWDAVSGDQIRSLTGHEEDPRALAFSGDGRFLLSGDYGGTILLWEAATGKQVRAFRGHQECVESVAFSPDGKTAASGSFDKTVRLWDIASGKESRSFDHPERVFSVAFLPDGQTLVAGGHDSEGNILLWDPATGRKRGQQKMTVQSAEFVAISRDGKLLAAGGGENEAVHLWALPSLKELYQPEGHVGGVLSLVPSSDGRFLVSGGRDNALRLWNPFTGKLLRQWPTGAERVAFVAFLPGDRTVLTKAGEKGALRKWDVATGEPIQAFTEQDLQANAVALSPDGTTLAGSKDGNILLWDAASGRLLRQLKGSHEQIRHVAFSPDGAVLAAISRMRYPSREYGVVLWQVTTGEKLHELAGRPAVPWCLVFSPDGRMLATGDGWERKRTDREDPLHAVCLWEVATGKQRAQFGVHSQMVMALTFSPDGRTLASAGQSERTIFLWDVGANLVRRAERAVVR